MFRAENEVERDKDYDPKTEFLPQPCGICNRLVFPNQNYVFTPTRTKRIYYHSSCRYLEENNED